MHFLSSTCPVLCSAQLRFVVVPQLVRQAMNESTPIAPPSRTAGNSAAVPSYQDSQLDTIVRYQRRINGPKPLKLPPATRRKRGNRENSIDWRFAGWGSIKHLDSLLVESSVQREDGQKKRRKTSNSGMRLGVWLGTGIAGVAVAGSPFYSFPAVIAVAGVLYAAHLVREAPR